MTRTHLAIGLAVVLAVAAAALGFSEKSASTQLAAAEGPVFATPPSAEELSRGNCIVKTLWRDHLGIIRKKIEPSDQRSGTACLSVGVSTSVGRVAWAGIYFKGQPLMERSGNALRSGLQGFQPVADAPSLETADAPPPATPGKCVSVDTRMVNGVARENVNSVDVPSAESCLGHTWQGPGEGNLLSCAIHFNNTLLYTCTADDLKRAAADAAWAEKNAK